MPATPNHRQRLGKRGEGLAARYLEESDYTILERNFRTPFGEIDIVAQKNDCLVFVEVRTKSSGTYGLPAESITQDKKAHLIAVAEEYLQIRGYEEREWRIDVIAIEVDPRGRVTRLELMENAVQL